MKNRPPLLTESAADEKFPANPALDVAVSKKPADFLRFIALMTRFLMITAVGLGA